MGTTAFARGAMLLVSGIIVLFATERARGEERLLSLSRVVEQAIEQNGDLKALRREKGVREAGRVRAGLLPNPTLDLEAGSGALTGSSSENSLAISLSQEFSLAGRREKRLTVAERELEIYAWQLADRERLLRDDVKGAFLDALLAGERLALADRSIALNRQLLEVAKERLAAGDIPELEMNLVRVELARSEGARIEAARGVLQSRARLWALMGLPSGQEPAISGNLEPGPAMTRPLAELQRLALANRPDLKLLAAERGRGEAEILLAEAESIPSLTLGVVLRRDATAIEVGGAEVKDADYSVGVRISIPIPIFDRNQAAIQEAGARKGSSESRLAAAVRGVERETASAFAAFQNASKMIGIYRGDIVPQLEENLKLTQEAWRLGEVGILAVIEEQKKFFEVSDGYLSALHGRQAALVKLESVTASELSGGGK